MSRSQIGNPLQIGTSSENNREITGKILEASAKKMQKNGFKPPCFVCRSAAALAHKRFLARYICFSGFQPFTSDRVPHYSSPHSCTIVSSTVDLQYKGFFLFSPKRRGSPPPVWAPPPWFGPYFGKLSAPPILTHLFRFLNKEGGKEFQGNPNSPPQLSV